MAKSIEAQHAGGSFRSSCTLIVVEGVSAFHAVKRAINSLDFPFYGICVLKGKVQNVRKTSEIKKAGVLYKIQQMLGLNKGEVYDSVESLRYGHLMIMTDQDHDGLHIKGLVINFIHFFWPSLLKLPEFLMEFITPIVKATHIDKSKKLFYTMPMFETWNESLDSEHKWTFKYYKGLGCHSIGDLNMYFKDLKTHEKYFRWVDEKDGQAIDMAFSGERTEERKNWIQNFKAVTYLNKTKFIRYYDFIYQELILYVLASIRRSIPSMVDGFKPVQRKILYAAFTDLAIETDTESLVLMASVQKHTQYNHGRTSLYNAIIEMTKSSVGSNNINLFNACGEVENEDNHTPDSRYISVNLNLISRVLFPKDDDVLLTYLNEGRKTYEPTWFVPIIPLILVNGCHGIGTGWSTNVPNHDPMDVCQHMRQLLNKEELKPIHPWYKGFQGTIDSDGKNCYTTSGLIEYMNDGKTARITALPINKSTKKFRKHLDKALDTGKSFIQTYSPSYDGISGHFDIGMSKKNIELNMDIVKELKLTSEIKTNNMHLFSSEGVLKKYCTQEQILQEFFCLRLRFYEERKKFSLANLNLKLHKVEFKLKLIEIANHGAKNSGFTLPEKADVLQHLKENDMLICFGEKKSTTTGSEEMNKQRFNKFYDDLVFFDFRYLNLVEEFKLERENLSKQLNDLTHNTPEDLWRKDLIALEQELELELKKDA